MPGPGSIRTKEYDAAKAAICQEHPEAEAVFDAACRGPDSPLADR